MTKLEKMKNMIAKAIMFAEDNGILSENDFLSASEEIIAMLQNMAVEIRCLLQEAAIAGEIPAIKYKLRKELEFQHIVNDVLEYNSNSKTEITDFRLLETEDGKKLLMVHGSNKLDFRGVGKVVVNGERVAVDDNNFTDKVPEGTYYMISCYPAAKGRVVSHNGRNFISEFENVDFPMGMALKGRTLFYYPCPEEYCKFFGVPVGIEK